MLSRLRQKVLQQLGSPELRPVDAGLVFVLISSLVAAGFAFQLYNSLQRTTAVYANREWIALGLAIQMRLVLPSAAALAGSCLILRKRRPDSKAMTHVIMQWAMLCVLGGSFVTGSRPWPCCSSTSTSYASGSSP